MKSFKQFGPLENFVTEEVIIERSGELIEIAGPSGADMEEAICAAYKIYCEKLKDKWKKSPREEDIKKYAKWMHENYGTIHGSTWHAALRIAAYICTNISDDGYSAHKSPSIRTSDGSIRLSAAVPRPSVTREWIELGQYAANKGTVNNEPKTDMIITRTSQNQISLKTHEPGAKGGARLMSASGSEATATVMVAAARAPDTKKAAIKKLNEYMEEIKKSFVSKVGYIKPGKGNKDPGKEITSGNLSAQDRKNLTDRINSSISSNLSGVRKYGANTKDKLIVGLGTKVFSGTNIDSTKHKNKDTEKFFKSVDSIIEKIAKKALQVGFKNTEPTGEILEISSNDKMIDNLFKNILSIYINIKDLVLFDDAEEKNIRSQLEKEIDMAATYSKIGTNCKKDFKNIFESSSNLAYQIAWEAATGLGKYSSLEGNITSPESTSTANVLLTVSKGGVSGSDPWHRINPYTGRDQKIAAIASNIKNFGISLKTSSGKRGEHSYRRIDVTLQVADEVKTLTNSIDYTLKQGFNMLNEELKFGRNILNEYYENFNSKNMSLLTEGVVTENRILNWVKERAKGAKELLNKIIKIALDKFNSWWNKIKDWVSKSWNNILSFMELDIDANIEIDW